MIICCGTWKLYGPIVLKDKHDYSGYILTFKSKNCMEPMTCRNGVSESNFSTSGTSHRVIKLFSLEIKLRCPFSHFFSFYNNIIHKSVPTVKTALQSLALDCRRTSIVYNCRRTRTKLQNETLKHNRFLPYTCTCVHDSCMTTEFTE